MGMLTISLDEEVENKIRREAAKKYGNRKGAIREYITEAVEHLAKEENETRQDEIAAEEIARMKKGFKIGYKYVSREKLWGRY